LFVAQEEGQLGAIPIPVVKGLSGAVKPTFGQVALLRQLIFGDHIAVVKMKEPDAPLGTTGSHG